VKLNSDRGACAYVMCMHMHACVLLLVCVFVVHWYLVCKSFSGFSKDLVSSIQIENVGFLKSGGDC